MGNLLSIILSNKDHGEFLPRLLSSIVSQTIPFDEIILIDDGSSDNSKEVMRNFKSDNPHLNVRLFLYDINLGWGTRATEGIHHSKCRFVFSTIKSAGQLLPQFVEKIRKALSSNRDIELCVATAYYDRTSPHFHNAQSDQVLSRDIRNNLSLFRRHMHHEPDCFFTKPQDISITPYIPGRSACINRNTLLKFGGYKAELKWHSDWFVLMAIAHTYGFYCLEEELVISHSHPDSYSSQKYDDNTWMEIFNTMKRILDEEEAYRICRYQMMSECFARINCFLLQSDEWKESRVYKSKDLIEQRNKIFYKHLLDKNGVGE
jgi:glycosyltransferase involved in cell wall biosynthesis